jgi:hypothetical protein
MSPSPYLCARVRQLSLVSICTPRVQPRVCADGLLRLFTPQPQRTPEPTLDHSGYEFGLNKLNQFNGDYIKAEMVRAFISSSEYRQRFGQ